MNEHILLVEDEQDIREAMAEALTTAGFQVTTASDGAEGVQLALKEKPDLILLDIVMPNMTGHEVLKKLRSDPWGNTVKIIMLTSMNNVENIAKAHEDSIADYIIKVHNSLDEIIRKVRLVLHSK